MSKRLRISLLLALCGLAAGCSNPFAKKDAALDVTGYKTSVKASKDNATFLVRVKNAQNAPEPAREAGRLAATAHCIKYFGASDVTWSFGPDDADDQLRFDDKTLLFEGVCDGA